MAKRKRFYTYSKRTRPQRSHPLSLSSNAHDLDMFFPSSDDVDFAQKPPPLPPKPTSQKAATMPAEPDESKIQQFVDFSGVPRAQAVRWLKVKPNVEAAMDALFSGTSLEELESGMQWDDSLFAAGKDGESYGQGEQHLRPLASSAAATRPNSPAPSQRSNLHPSSKEEEDDDMRRAMAMSQNELGGYGGQESGVVGGQVFGPANREFYDANQWAMVPVGATEGTEVVPDATPDQRVNVDGEPRFLKPLPSGDYVPNLLTICAAVEGVREGMMMREVVKEEYGEDAEWWRGQPISLPRVVHMEDGRPVERDDQEEVVMEVQRLMAFLRASARSYGSAGALTQTGAIQSTTPASTRSRTLLELFLQTWTVAAASKAENPEEYTGLFTTTVGTNATEGMETTDMSLIDLQVMISEDSKMDLLELLDGHLWDTDGDKSNMADNYIERAADALVMRAFQANSTLGPQLRVEVPAHFYVDKYLKENVESTRATRLEMAKGRKRIAKIEDIERRLKNWKHPKKNESIAASSLLKHTLGHFNGQNQTDPDTNSTPNTSNHPPHYPEIAAKLDQIITNIDQKLTVLASEKEKTRQAIAQMSKAPPQGLKQEDQKHHYILRGVATKPNITYILAPRTTPGDEQEEGMFDDENTPPGFRWWRIEYEVSPSGNGAKVTKTKANDYDVLRAVELEHHSALLVYASDRVNFPPSSTQAGQSQQDHLNTLPGPLRDFVLRDTERFLAEVQAAVENRPPPAYTNLMDAPRESIERAESPDSTRVEGSESGDGFDGAGFGVGEEIKQGFERMEEDAPVHEIRLDDGGEGGTEMVERVHEPFVQGEGQGSGAGRW